MNPICKIKEDFSNRNISKQDYLNGISEVSCQLFNIVEAMPYSPVKNINISPLGLTFDVEILEGRIITFASSQLYDINTYLLFRNSAYETKELTMFMNIIKDGDAIFDIGANVGVYSILSRMQKNNITAYSFEPDVETYKMLLKSHQLNSLSDNNLYNFGFSDEQKTTTFYVNRKDYSAYSLKNLEYSEGVEETTCEVRLMDSFVKDYNIQKLDVIKCDVEGAELLVLKGGINTIRHFRPIIQLEMLRKWSSKFDYHPNDIIKLLAHEGYKCFVSNDSSDKLTSFDKVDDNTIETNYYFFHKGSKRLSEFVN